MNYLSRRNGPKGVFPELPLELLHVVATHADRHSLTQLCLANSIVGDVAASHLYTDLRLSRPAAMVRCLRTLSKHPELGKRVRVLSVRLDVDVKPCLTDAFGTLLRRALRNMPYLVSLELDLCEDGFGRYLLGSPARVTNVSLACDWNEDLSVWFREQPGIQRFIFYGYPHLAISLHPSALPNLEAIYAMPSVISLVVPSRPVKRVFATTSFPGAFSTPAMETMARSCKLSAGPVGAVYLIHSTPRRGRALLPSEIFGRLSSIPKHLPGLAKFSMQVYSYAFEEPLCNMLRDFAAQFRELQYLDLFTKERGGEGSELNKLKLPDLARSFGQRCPSLRSVRFSVDSFYAYRSAGEWIGIWDMDRLQDEVVTKFGLQNPAAREVRSASPADPSRPIITPELKAALLRDMKTSVNRLRVAMSYRGTTTARCLGVMSPETDADVVASINLAYGALRRILETQRPSNSGSIAST
ncbi:hypothetical protein C8T65DRAFT_655195 [Cerioporus squamosus]|nr:hypothetical protein C8T65DRAFT_655195 [Cerioporus squamosus]